MTASPVPRTDPWAERHGRASRPWHLERQTPIMRGMLFTFAAMISAALGGAVCVLWAGSWRTDHQLGYASISTQAGQVVEHRSGLFSAHGRISLANGKEITSHADYLRTMAARLPAEQSGFGWWSGDFGFFHGERDETFVLGFGQNGDDEPDDAGEEYHVVSVPHWFVVLMLAVAPGVWLLARRGRGRRAAFGVAIILYVSLAGFAVLMIETYGLILIVPPIVLLILAVPIADRLYRIPTRAARRLTAGQCPACGYDLRATPGRCPECGAVPAKLDPSIAPAGR